MMRGLFVSTVVGSGLVALSCFVDTACGNGLPHGLPTVPTDRCVASTSAITRLCGGDAGGVFSVACQGHGSQGVAYPHDCVQSSATCDEAMKCK
jgi:hypothetical protein